MCVCVLNHVRLFVSPQTVAHQGPLSMGFPRQEHWSGVPCPPPGHLPGSESEPMSIVSPALAGRFLTTLPPEKLFVQGISSNKSNNYNCHSDFQSVDQHFLQEF